MDDTLIAASYDFRLVTLSIVVASAAAFVALELATRVAGTCGSRRFTWVLGGATSMGLGIWSMHFVGMEAYKLPIPVAYDIVLVVTSLVAAVIASAIALSIVSLARLTLPAVGAGSAAMGLAIGGMHYIGMAAMRLPAMHRYDARLVALSMLIAVLVSGVALLVSFALRTSRSASLKVVGASVMGLAVAGMHYTAMAAVTFRPSAAPVDLSGAVPASALGLTAIVSVTVLVLGFTITVVHLDRLFGLQASALAASEARFRTLFDRSPAGIFEVTLEGRILSCNSAFAEILGFESVAACTAADADSHYVNTTDRQRFLDQVQSVGVLRDFTNRLRRRDGSELWVLENAVLLPSTNGESPVLQGTIIDITARVRAEVALREAQKLESVGRLAAGVAHEINTPIQFVSDSVTFVKDAMGDLGGLIAQYRRAIHESPGPETSIARPIAEAEDAADLDYLLENVPRSLERALEGLGRVAEIVRSMKEFAHPDQKEMAEVELNRAIESTLVIARNEYKYVADLDVEYGELPVVICHAGDINQVVLNVVVNAAHAIEDAVRGTSARGRITVRTFASGGDAVIRISDTGPGIPSGVQAHVFEPFYTTKEVGRGTGQGLAIARTIIDAHGGALTFDTSPSGTTFQIRLPLAGAPSEAAA
ncbi:MAG: MHYT domain-containing protein [Vicinamibacterales bacterium]